MTFSESVRAVLSRYATFTGRARRAEYWWFYLFTILVGIAASVVDALLDAAVGNQPGVVGLLAALALLLPTIAVTARRLHDTGRSAWWMLLPVVPALVAVTSAVAMFFALFDSPGGTVTETYVPDAPESAALWAVLAMASGVLAFGGWVTLVVFMCLDSRPGPNKYGPSPKYPSPPYGGPGGFHPAAGYGSLHPQPAPYGYPSRPPMPPIQDGPTQQS